MANSDYYIYYYVDNMSGRIILNSINKKEEIDLINTKNTKALQIKKLKYPIFKQNYIRTLNNCKHTKENLQLLFDMIEGEDILINKIDFQPPLINEQPASSQIKINEAEEGQHEEGKDIKDNKNARRSLNLFKDGQLIKHVESDNELIGMYLNSKNIIQVIHKDDVYEITSLNKFVELHYIILKINKKVKSGWTCCLYKDNDKWISTNKIKAIKI